MHRMRWDDLQFVHAVIEHGSLSGAARALRVNHATVLRRLVLLEKAHGVRLFDRPPGGYCLRPEWREIDTSLQIIGRTADRIERAFTGVGKGIEGSFRLTTTDAIASLILPKHLSALSKMHPKARIELAITNSPIDMSRPAAEIALRPAHQLPEGLSGRRIGAVPFQIFGSAAYLDRNPSSNLGEHRWLGVAPPIMRSPAGKWQEEQLHDGPGVAADSFLVLAALAEQGMGLAMLPAFVARHHGELIRAPQFYDEESINFWVASHPDLLLLDHMTPLIDFFSDALSSDAALLM